MAREVKKPREEHLAKQSSIKQPSRLNIIKTKQTLPEVLMREEIEHVSAEDSCTCRGHEMHVCG